MLEELMDEKSRDLILAAEITGLLHDLGKLRAEFAEEKSRDGKSRLKNVKNAIQTDAHGAILEEDKRAYPEKGKDDWLQQLKNHEGWAEVLKLPETWIKSKTVQALGLGDALRQHHATGKFLAKELTLLGDIYTVGADWRDSALDKTSVHTQSGEQRLAAAYITDSFGNETQSYQTQILDKEWNQVAKIIKNRLLSNGAWKNVIKTRKAFFKDIEPIFRKALGATQRPTNDVTLWHHCFSTASLFKAAMTEGVLCQDFRHLQDDHGMLDFAKLGCIRFRLLGIRWDWAALTQGALKPVVFTALTAHRNEAIRQLHRLLELNNPIGNIIYKDDNGVVLVVPGFYESSAEGQQSEDLFRQYILEPLETKILNALAHLGAGTPVRIAWTRPRLYLTDYNDVMPVKSQDQRERLLQTGEDELQKLWAKPTKGQIEICSQCGLRPSQARELNIGEGGLTQESLCEFCADLLIEDEDDEEQTLSPKEIYIERTRQAIEHFGWAPRTFNLHKIRQRRNKNTDNARVMLLSVHIDAQEIANGMPLLTQVVRPPQDLDYYLFTEDEILDWSGFCEDLQSGTNEIAQAFRNFLDDFAKKNKETEKTAKRVQDGIRDFADKKEVNQKAKKAIITQLQNFFDKKKSKLRLMQQAFPEKIAPVPVDESTEIGEFLQQVIDSLSQEKQIDSLARLKAQAYIGDSSWLNESDKRIEKGDTSANALELIEEFFLRESVPEGLSRHTGDKLAIFGMRKHASPGRLARIWDDLRQLWQEILEEIGMVITKSHAIPLSLDAQGFRVIVAAEDARAALTCIHDIIQERLNKVRAGFNPHVSALVFNEKFPLYVAFDAMRRMERRITDLPPQKWQLLNKETLKSGLLRLTWKTPHGKIAWTMNLNTGDPSQEDLWYPHVICTSKAEGPGRIVHVKDLKEDDTIQLRPATFDFAVLEGTTRRYQLVYDKENEGRRYHFILGKRGRPPYLLEQMPEIMNFVPDTLQDWDGTRRKMFFGQVVEYYEKFVRDVPEELQEKGRKAWHTHVNAILLRYLSKDVQHKRQEILDMLDDGRFFDAFEWADFVEKSAVVDKK
ncbi:hypothetical protein PN36_14865 [Candidatus Thiomargarita nelsonii]|uniref:CRISPR-associated protein Csx11 n=1 Tax=Candidatus Thiomargarita nelsonii TaxID=1003181 RepID=A0A0A6PBJ0_9GAMM|nr:hypothetical protein PN36_14865 [Candidatus Thiomargarita nelsonii]